MVTPNAGFTAAVGGSCTGTLVGNTFTLDIDGDGKLETINLSADDLGIPKVKRKYVALDFFADGTPTRSPSGRLGGQ